MSLSHIYDTRSRDWVLFVDTQLTPLTLETRWNPQLMSMMMWSTGRQDGRTFVWIQGKEPLTQGYMRDLFPTTQVCTATTPEEEFTAWMARRNRHGIRFRGRYHIRPRQPQVAGKLRLEQLLLDGDGEEDALDLLEIRIQNEMYAPYYDDTVSDTWSDQDSL